MRERKYKETTLLKTYEVQEITITSLNQNVIFKLSNGFRVHAFINDESKLVLMSDPKGLIVEPSSSNSVRISSKDQQPKLEIKAKSQEEIVTQYLQNQDVEELEVTKTHMTPKSKTDRRAK